ncbi:MAG: hypothetical protein ACK4IT_06370 [Thioalkalivibrionaceae bacterium]
MSGSAWAALRRAARGRTASAQNDVRADSSPFDYAVDLERGYE